MSQSLQPTGDSYSQWVRRIVTRKNAHGRLIPLFESSVPEPRELLAEIVAKAFSSPVSTRYTSAFAQGNPFVVEALRRHYRAEPENILCTTGATSAIALLYRVLVEKGQEILAETPGFDLFQDLARQAGIPCRTFRRSGKDFALDIDEIERGLTPSTRLIILSDLHNPSGHAASPVAMQALAQLAERKNLIVVVDEVYADYVPATARPAHAAALSPNLVTVSSLTKNFGLSTLRCGWIVAEPTVLDPVRSFAGRSEFGVSNLAHAVAALVLESRSQFLAYSADVVSRARAVIAPYFYQWRDAGIIEGDLPPFGCIVFPRLLGVPDSIAFADWLAERTGVVVAPGEYFGAPGHVRIGFGFEPAQLKTGLLLLDEGLRAYDAALPLAARG